ncbi:MAG: hypothetical protein AB1523_01360 [Bacillota bacterium]
MIDLSALDKVIKSSLAATLVKMEITAERVNLSVGDDGKGFNLAEVSNNNHPGGCGLINIRERAQL